MLQALLLCPLALLAPLVPFAQDEPRLLPGQRLEGVERAVLVVDSAGTYTLCRSNGALVLGEQRSEDGWLITELDEGDHTVELPDGPGDVSALSGAVASASSATFLNRAIAQVNAAEYPGATVSLLACRARPGPALHDGLARMFQGRLAQLDGRLAEARELLLGAQEAVDASGSPDLVAFAADSLGQVALALRDWELAQQCFERVAELMTDPAGKAFALSRQAQVAAERLDPERARALHEEALALLTEESEPTYVSSVCFEAGRFFENRGELSRAAELLERAASAAPRWDLSVAALGQLGLLELVRGRYGAALGRLDAVAALAAEHSPSPYDAIVLRARGALAFSLGEYGVARECAEQELLLREDPDERAMVLANLALFAYVQDEEDRAERLYDEALGSAQASSRSRWYVLNGKAALQYARDLPEEAQVLAGQALALAGQLDDAQLRALSLVGVAGAAARMGQGEAARTAAEAGLAILEEQGARDLFLPAWHSLARAALVQGDDATVERLLDQAWAESLREDVSALVSLEAAQVRSRVAELSDWGEVDADLSARQASEERADVADVADGLRRAERWKARTLLADVQGHPQVPDDLVESVRTMLAGRTLVEYAVGEQRLHAFVVRADDLRFVDLGPRRPIEALVREFLGGLTDANRLAEPAQVVRVGKALHAALLQPLGLDDEGLVVVPGGDLARLPFEALVVAAPEEARDFAEVEFVLDRRDIGYAPSAATLLALERRTPPPEGGRALLLGDPMYVAEGAPTLLATRGASATRWERLPHTRAELNRVARMLLTLQDDEAARDALYQLAQLEDQRDVSFSAPSFDLRLGGAASTEALRSLAPGARLIHIAAHAQVDRWDARRTGLVLAWDEDEQGLFSLADVAAMRLDAELVVLSACQTADGRLLNGEGVQSMAGAFLAAGARGVVATLWPVSDAQSQTLMERFESAYLVDGETPERALRLAKREARAAPSVRGGHLQDAPINPRRGHPHDWAPFLFSGAGAARSR
jgi:CHAT domain-containing protein/tetratricopeptide (TPR) repeat protein